ncbi:hypothetical protein [Verticiella sediminum]|uniref:hypothetical protein n=1 Tax=Verticiella sediminum TaxID=1247510 RepID=UPI001B86BAC2|nr:hypothetical protein [Verticiella sediminum]
MISNNTLLVFVVVAVTLMLIGFGFRDRNLGVILAGVGFLGALAAAVYKAVQILG